MVAGLTEVICKRIFAVFVLVGAVGVHWPIVVHSGNRKKSRDQNGTVPVAQGHAGRLYSTIAITTASASS